jgi:hypothetical protein
MARGGVFPSWCHKSAFCGGQLSTKLLVTGGFGGDLLLDLIQFFINLDRFLVELRRKLAQEFRFRMKFENELSALVAWGGSRMPASDVKALIRQGRRKPPVRLR